MTQEEKQLLLKDLCARLAFGRVKCQVKVLSFNEEMDEYGIELLDDEIVFIEPGIYNAYLYEEGTDVDISDIKPYLRPMSSMTEGEIRELSKILNYEFCTDDDFALVAEDGRHRIRLDLIEAYTDWLLSRHFDYRGLIEMGLALVAPPGMYDKEEPEEWSEVPIPKTVDEAVKTLAKIVSKEDRDYLLENGAISMHHSMGRWIRNEWGLWTGSELKNELKKKGFEHPDDMSNYIIEEFIKYWHNKI